MTVLAIRSKVAAIRRIAKVRLMIKRYSDHAANERTFLAWVRTAIAVMAFGFLIERFDLFLKFAAPQFAQRQLAPHGEGFANWAGLAFIVIGVVTVVMVMSGMSAKWHIGMHSARCPHIPPPW